MSVTGEKRPIHGMALVAFCASAIAWRVETAP